MSVTVVSTNNSFSGATTTSASITASAGDTIGMWLFATYATTAPASGGTVSDNTASLNTYTINSGASFNDSYVTTGYITQLSAPITSILWTPPPSPVPSAAGLFIWRITATGTVSYSANAAVVVTSTLGTDAVTTGPLAITTGNGLIVCAGQAGNSTMSVGTGFTSDGSFIFGNALAEHGAFSATQAATFTDSNAGDTIYLGALSFQIPGAATGSAVIAWIT
jgi:hypothetical protein